jgi:SDR family mycofactocin-dependent oxidoreductase
VSGRVEGKVAFITGAARGQGRSHAVRLAEEGADIIAIDLCEQVEATAGIYPGATSADLEETVALVEATDRRIVALEADVRDLDELQAAFDRGRAELGRIDIVCANAGIFAFGRPAHLVEEAEWQQIVDINQTGVWHTCKVAIPAMIDQGDGGSIVLISSTAGLKGAPFILPYGASKHAVVGMMRTLALELGPHRIRVNTIHPGTVATGMILNDAAYKLMVPGEERPTKEQAREVFEAINTLPVPWVEPADISNALLFLVSDEARYVTGNELKVDAGYTVK